MRLDVIATQKLEISREKTKKLILDGRVLVNGNVQKLPKFEVQESDEITCTETLIIPTNEIKPNHEIELNIVFEDEHILVINKQKGLMVHEGAAENFKTVVNILVAKYGDDFRTVGSQFRPGIVHRLDKDTTGLMIIAKNQKAFDVLTEMVQNRDFTRKYLAVCCGVPRLQAGMIKANLDIDLTNRQKRKVVQFGGKEAVTHYRTLDSRGGFSLIECKLETGRTHQIRVHLAHIGIPIVGDPLYNLRPLLRPLSHTLGKELSVFTSQLLHAYQLELKHPITHEPLSFTAKEFLNDIEFFNFMPVF